MQPSNTAATLKPNTLIIPQLFALAPHYFRNLSYIQWWIDWCASLLAHWLPGESFLSINHTPITNLLNIQEHSIYPLHLAFSNYLLLEAFASNMSPMSVISHSKVHNSKTLPKFEPLSIASRLSIFHCLLFKNTPVRPNILTFAFNN